MLTLPGVGYFALTLRAVFAARLRLVNLCPATVRTDSSAVAAE